MKRLAALLLVWLAVPLSHAVEIARWDRVPLKVTLIVEQERVILVDRPVRIGVPTLLTDALSVQSAGGAVYLRARLPFEATRIELQDTQTGSLILLDVSAHIPSASETPLEPLRIVSATATSAAGTTLVGRSTNVSTPADARRPTPVPVALTRYAAQSLYAPLRAIEPLDGVSRVPLRGDLPLGTLLAPLAVDARALIAWRLDDYWVTAIKLTNRAPHWIELDPRDLQGDFTAATFQHPNVGPAGQPSDTTVLYLVTRSHGLAESLLPAIAPFDPAVSLRAPPAASGEQNAQ